MLRFVMILSQILTLARDREGGGEFGISSDKCINSFPTKYRSYLLKLISIFGHFLTVNNRRYGRCYVKKLNHCVLYTHLEANSARSFQDAFYMCSGALNIMFLFLKTSCF